MQLQNKFVMRCQSVFISSRSLFVWPLAGCNVAWRDKQILTTLSIEVLHRQRASFVQG